MKLPLKAILIGGFVGLQLIAVLVILVSSYVTSERVLVGHARTIMENLVTYIVNRSEDYLAPARDAARLTERLANHDIVSSSNQSQMEQYFYEQLDLHGYLAGLYYATTDGDFLYAMRTDARSSNGFLTKIIEREGEAIATEFIWKDANFTEFDRQHDSNDRFDPRVRPWYRKAVEAGSLVWTDPYMFYTAKKPGITTASPVYSGGTLVGVVGVDIEIGAISRFLSELRIGAHGKAFILNRNGDVIAFPEADKMQRPEGESTRLARITELEEAPSRLAYLALGRPAGDLRLDSPVFSEFEHQGRRYHSLFAPFNNPQWPWVIGVYVPEDDFLGPIKRNRQNNVYLALLIATITSLIGFWMARNLGTTMRAIRAEALAIRGIDLHTTYDKRSFIKEVQETSDAFSQMKSGLESYKVQTEALTEDLRDKARALEAKETRLRATFTSLLNFTDALLILDAESRIRFINPAAERLLGMRAKQASGRRPPFECQVGVRGQITLTSGGSARTAELTVVSTEWEGRPAQLAILRDVTERHRAESSLADSHDRLQDKVTELQRRETQLTAINKMAELFHVCGSEDEVLKVVADTLPKLFPVEAGAIYVHDLDRKVLQCSHRWGEEPAPIEFFGPGKCWALKQSRPHLVQPGYSTLHCEHANAPDRAVVETLCLPFYSRQGQLGLIHLRQSVGTREDLPGLAWFKDYGVMVAEHIALALSNARLQEDLQYLAIHDPLTGLHNRRYLKDVFTREIGRSHRDKSSIGLLIMDVDFFKQTNDQFGHDAGDHVLVRLSALLREHTRSTDVLCRFGGEEFVLLMIGSTYEDSLARAQALRETLRHERFFHNGQDLGPITLSFGVAAFPEHGGTTDAIIKAGDNAMYLAKSGGRDRICGARGDTD